MVSTAGLARTVLSLWSLLLMQAGWEQLQAGQAGDAERTARQALAADPGRGDALELLGGVLLAQGRLGEAVACLRRAAAAVPERAEVHFQLGQALRRQGDLPGAVAAYQAALARLPGLGEAHQGLGLALVGQGRLADALVHFSQAARLCPDNAHVQQNLGTVLLDLDRPAEAVAPLRQAVRLAPAMVDAHHNLGRAYRRLEQLDQAIACLQDAVRLGPDSWGAHTDLAEALAYQGELPQALAHFRAAARLAPGQANVQRNLGLALVKLGELPEAAAALEASLRLAADSADAWNGLGFARWRLGRYSDGMACVERALALDPQHVGAHLNRALLRLTLGDFAHGWAEFEYRWQSGTIPPPPPLGAPEWDGSSLAGRTILLHTEQGAGDSIQFVRYAALVKQRGATVYLACPANLVRLLRGCPGIDRVVVKGQALPPFDGHAPLMSLPRLLDTMPDTIPAPVSYLAAEPALVEHWRGVLAGEGGFKVGITWQGSRKHPDDPVRSVPLTAFAPLASVPGVRLYSLQKGAGTEQLATAGFPVTDLGRSLDETTGTFVDTAAVVRNLDLVVSVDTAPVHLAGALGVPTWVALSHVADWRWQTERTDSPWYPSVRLFRQPERGQWAPVFARIAAELEALVGAPRRTAPVLVEVPAGELIDKITILEIKSERLSDVDKLANVRAELATLASARNDALPASAALAALTAELKKVNEALWEVEDDIRICERGSDFGPRFVELARSVYRHNDRRAALKRRINELLGSRLVEEKGYAPYEAGPASSSET
jgi:tetratricopeptide (TPR) repeat protein